MPAKRRSAIAVPDGDHSQTIVAVRSCGQPAFRRARRDAEEGRPVLDRSRGSRQTRRWSRTGRRLSVIGPAGWGFESPRRHRRRSSIGQSSGHSAVTYHARPGPCLSRSGYPLVVVPGTSLDSRATSEERMVRVGRRRSVTTSHGRVAGSSPAATGRVSSGGVAQLVEQLPAVNPTPTRTSRKSGPEFLRLPGRWQCGFEPCARVGSPTREICSAVSCRRSGGRHHARSFAPMLAVAGRSEIGYLSQRSPRRRAARAIGSGRFASHARRRLRLPGGGSTWMCCGR